MRTLHLLRSIRACCALLLLLLSGLSAMAQSADQFTRWGDAAMRSNDAYGASRFYADALDLEPGLLDLQWKFAEACRGCNRYTEAAAAYGKVFRKDQGRRYPEALRWLAEMQLCSGAPAEAEKTWTKVKQKERDKGSVVAQRADHGLAGARMAQQASAQDSVTVERPSMPLNSYDSEFGARLGPDGLLYFTSLRGTLDEEEVVQDTSSYHAGRMRARPEALDREPEWLMPERTVSEANQAWDTTGRWTYFTRCVPGTPCRIHVAPMDAPQNARPLEGIGAAEMSTQPMVALVAGVQTLFFTTDRAGGSGGLDLWAAHLDGDRVTDLRPLVGVNTPGQECTPFFEPVHQQLWFASDFLPGFGGYDLFTAQRLADGTFAPPVNKGRPFNGPANDLYPMFDATTGSGWFTSNRIGSYAHKGSTCCNDLYRFELEGHRAAPRDSLPIHARITPLREKLPVRLYFHNDEPGPRSWDTTTTQDYAATYRAYKALLPDYRAAWEDRAEGTTAIETFFTYEVDRGYDDLQAFSALLLQALEEGGSIELQVRGFASPLAKSDYNRNLSLRRIESLVNFLQYARNGALAPYLQGTATNGARLTIVKQPFGKSQADPTVSDRLDDLLHSVYGVGASRERRIEIEQVLLGK